MRYLGTLITIEEREEADKLFLEWKAKVDGVEYGGFVEIVAEEDLELMELALLTSAKNFIDERNGLDPMESAYRRLEELDE